MPTCQAWLTGLPSSAWVEASAQERSAARFVDDLYAHLFGRRVYVGPQIGPRYSGCGLDLQHPLNRAAAKLQVLADGLARDSDMTAKGGFAAGDGNGAFERLPRGAVHVGEYGKRNFRSKSSVTSLYFERKPGLRLASMVKTTFAERFESRLKALDLSHKDVGDHFHISREAVSQWLLPGRLPRPQKWKKLAEILKCNKEWLIDGTGEMEAEVMPYEDLAFLKRLKKLTNRQRRAVEAQVEAYEESAEEHGAERTAHPRK